MLITHVQLGAIELGKILEGDPQAGRAQLHGYRPGDTSGSQAAIAQVMTASRSARLAPSRACTDRPCTTVV